MRNKRTLLPALLAAGMLLSGCGTKPAEVQSLKPETAETMEEAEPVLKEPHTETLPETKEETVSAKADASGTVKETKVEVTLSGMKEGEYVRDISFLRDIRNMEGDEEFFLLDGERLLFENSGKTIQYEGKTDRSLPVSVSIRYWLNDQQIQPDELAGRSGHVKIRFDYSNHTVEKEDQGEVSGVPFAAITLVPLSDRFSDVKTDGKRIRFGDREFVAGFAMPGMKELLRPEQYEPSEDLDFPESFEIEAQVEEFQLDFTATAVSSGLLEDFDEAVFEDAETLQDDTRKLSDASLKLAEGTAELSSGMKEFGNYLRQYTDGISRAGDGISGLRDGLKLLDDASGDLNSGAKALAAGLLQLNQSLAGLDPGELIPDNPDEQKALEAAIKDLAIQAGSIPVTVSALLEMMEAMNAFSQEAEAWHASILDSEMKLIQLKEEAEVQLLSEEEKEKLKEALGEERAQALIEYSDQLPERLNAVLAELDAKIPECPQLDQKEIEKATAALGGSIGSVLGDLAILSEYVSGLQEMMSGLSELPELLVRLQDGTARLADGGVRLAEGICAYTDGVEKIAEGADMLKSAADQLPSAGNALNEGYGKISEGSGELSDGMEKFNREGIQKIKDLTGSEFSALLRRARAAVRNDRDYQSFTGLPEGVRGSVRFLIETEEIH